MTSSCCDDDPRLDARSRVARLVRARAPELAAAAIGLVWFLLIGGHRAISPSRLDWIHGGDRLQHLIGWLFFRSSPPLGLPLGSIPGLPWPVGTSVALTDANPLLALALRPLSPLLPRDFQYLGPWLAACFALQGWAGARLAALASASGVYRTLAGTLFVLAPPLTERLGHATLCMHAAIVALLVLNAGPRRDADGARRALRGAAAIVLLASAVHPYLAVMVLALALALVFRLARHDGALAARSAWRWSFGLVLAQVAVFLVLGYLTSAPSHGSGFGEFSTDLLALVNPLGVSRLLPTFPLAANQWEGNAYLGAGGLLLCLVAAVAAVARRRALASECRPMLPVLVVAIALFAFALSSRVTLLGHAVLDLEPVYRPLHGLVAPFRASGRFAWPIFYLVLSAAVLSLPRTIGPLAATVVLAAAITLQTVDLSGYVDRVIHERPWRGRAPEWALARGHYDHLAMYPPQLRGTGTNNVCGTAPSYEPDAYAALAYRAYELGLTFNSAYLSRAHRKRLTAACGAFLRDVEAGRLDARTIYVVHPELELRFQALPTTCGRLDDRLVCVLRSNEDAFRNALSAR